LASELAIDTHQLTKFYGKNRGVVDLDLDVRRGEIYGFVGPNGAGKSTTVRLLLDFIRPTRGSATILGMDLQRQSRDIRAQVGYLPGELRMYENLTGQQLLRFFANVRGVTDTTYMHEIAERLSTELGRRIGTLSRGNKQKLGVVQALMHRPDLVLFDEATSGLDPLMQQELYGILNEYRAQGGTVFFSSHYLDEVERICDRVGVIRDGKLILSDTLEAIQEKHVRRLRLEFAEPPPDDFLTGLPGVQKESQEGTTVIALVQDNLSGALKQAAQHTVIDLEYEERRLEDIFLQYYDMREEGDAAEPTA
jgi:ABC-2 type transport system ATP-binding protein